MGETFQAFVLGLGVMLGIVEGGATPVLQHRLADSGGSIWFTCEVSGGRAPPIDRLLVSGNTIRIALTVKTNRGFAWEFSRELTYDPESQFFTIKKGEDGTKVVTGDIVTAWVEASRFLAIRLSRVEDLTPPVSDAQPLTIKARATLYVNKADWDETAVLWSYHRPTLSLAVSSLSEIGR